MVQVSFAHDIGDEVVVVANPDITVRVVGMAKRVYGKTYCCVWWQDGIRREEWLNEWEIKRGDGHGT